jgi:hypothetical protein
MEDLIKRICPNCGRIMPRTVYKDGTMESLSEYKKKKYCNKDCYADAIKKQGKFIDLTGKRFGMVTVIGFVRVPDCYGRPLIKWKCKCDCGNVKIMDGTCLRNGSTKSCGCWRNKRHGMSYSKLYTHWQSMKNRCSPSYHDPSVYYERGITVCNEWKNSFENFMDWALSNGYQEGLTLDRIDNDGNYEPDNCRWATMKEQSNNRRTTVRYELYGKNLTLGEWSEISGIQKETIRQRILHGWKLEDAIFKQIEERYMGRKGVSKNNRHREQRK